MANYTETKSNITFSNIDWSKNGHTLSAKARLQGQGDGLQNTVLNPTDRTGNPITRTAFGIDAINIDWNGAKWPSTDVSAEPDTINTSGDLINAIKWASQTASQVNWSEINNRPSIEVGQDNSTFVKFGDYELAYFGNIPSTGGIHAGRGVIINDKLAITTDSSITYISSKAHVTCDLSSGLQLGPIDIHIDGDEFSVILPENTYVNDDKVATQRSISQTYATQGFVSAATANCITQSNIKQYIKDNITLPDLKNNSNRLELQQIPDNNTNAYLGYFVGQGAGIPLLAMYDAAQANNPKANYVYIGVNHSDANMPITAKVILSTSTYIGSHDLDSDLTSLSNSIDSLHNTDTELYVSISEAESRIADLETKVQQLTNLVANIYASLTLDV